MLNCRSEYDVCSSLRETRDGGPNTVYDALEGLVCSHQFDVCICKK